MNLNDLPREILTHCFSYLSTELLTNIILLDNIPDNILEAAADNLNHLWYANKLLYVGENAIINDHYETSIEHDQIASDQYNLETEFDRFLNIHKVLEKKSIRRPLWFHYNWENIFEMRRDLDEINSVYRGQKLGINADLKDMPSSCVRFFSDHDMNLKITCLSLSNSKPINLNDFPKLETFYGDHCNITVEHNHPSLKNLYLKEVTFSSLPVDLERLVAKNCHITMKEDHPKLEGLRVLVLQDIYRGRPFLLQKLWNKDLETFSYIEELSYNDDRDEVINLDEIMSMIGPKVTNFGFNSSSFSGIPTLLRSLYSDDSRNESSDNHIRLFDLTAFTYMTSLTLELPRGLIDSLELPPNLLKLSISRATFQDFERISLPPRIVDLELTSCHITLTTGWLKPARLKRLSLWGNDLSSFRAFLPCCEYLSLSNNKSLTDLEIEAPLLESINLRTTLFTSIPKLPDSLQVLGIGTSDLSSDLRLSGMSELPSSLKVLYFDGNLDIQDFTFPPSIQEIYFGDIDELQMTGVKFAEGSKLKELDLSGAGLPDIDYYNATAENQSYMFDGGPYGGPQSLTYINDGMIELPPGLKALKMRDLCLRYIDDFTIPQSVTFLDLRENHLSSFEVKSHIETLYIGVILERQWKKLNFVVHKDLELRVLDLAHIGLKKFSFDTVKAEKLDQLHLGSEVEMIDLSKMPANFQILEHIVRGSCTVIEPDTGQSYIYERIPYNRYL